MKTIKQVAWDRYLRLDNALARRRRVRNRLCTGYEGDWHDQGIDRMKPAIDRAFCLAWPLERD